MEKRDSKPRDDRQRGRDYSSQRSLMVSRQLAARGVKDKRVLNAMGAVPRELFLPPERRRRAYEDRALPLSHSQTVSQPYVVASTLQALRLTPECRVLEIGAGSGYAAAVTGLLAAEVVALERIEALAERSRRLLAELGYNNVTVVWVDGTEGFAEHAPYDAIFISAATPRVSPALFKQLAAGGRLVAPVGHTSGRQELAVYVQPRTDEPNGEGQDKAGTPPSESSRTLFPVTFVPLLPGVESKGADSTGS